MLPPPSEKCGKAGWPCCPCAEGDALALSLPAGGGSGLLLGLPWAELGPPSGLANPLAPSACASSKCGCGSASTPMRLLYCCSMASSAAFSFCSFPVASRECSSVYMLFMSML